MNQPINDLKNLDPRSDLSDDDEMIQELVKTVKNMNQQGKENIGRFETINAKGN